MSFNMILFFFFEKINLNLIVKRTKDRIFFMKDSGDILSFRNLNYRISVKKR